MDKSANRLLAALASLLLLFGAGAAAQDYGPPLTPNEAHQFLGGLFERYSIGYVVWHGGRTRDNDRGRAGFYGGRDCFSELGTNRDYRIDPDGRAFAVDWSLVSLVERSGPDAVYVTGQLLRPARDEGARGRRYANFHLYLPDAGVSKSVFNAFEVLRSACQRRSRFD
jgi:hypothetical protein